MIVKNKNITNKKKKKNTCKPAAWHLGQMARLPACPPARLPACPPARLPEDYERLRLALPEGRPRSLAPPELQPPTRAPARLTVHRSTEPKREA